MQHPARRRIGDPDTTSRHARFHGIDQGQAKSGRRDRPDRELHVIMQGLEWTFKQFVSYMPVNWPIKTLMTVAATWFVSRAVTGSPDAKMAHQDVVVYSAIYCGWAIFFLPDVLLHLSAYILGKVFWLFFRLFSAELVICLYLHFCKEEKDVLIRGVSLRPMLRPEYQWMEELVHSVRFVLIVGCLSASLVANLFDRPEILIDFVAEDDDDNEADQ